MSPFRSTPSTSAIRDAKVTEEFSEGHSHAEINSHCAHPSWLRVATTALAPRCARLPRLRHHHPFQRFIYIVLIRLILFITTAHLRIKSSLETTPPYLFAPIISRGDALSTPPSSSRYRSPSSAESETSKDSSKDRVERRHRSTRDKVSEAVANKRGDTFGASELEEVLNLYNRCEELEHLILMGDSTALLINCLRAAQKATLKEGEPLLPHLDMLADKTASKERRQRKTGDVGQVTPIIKRCIQYLVSQDERMSIDMETVRLAVQTYRTRCINALMAINLTTMSTSKRMEALVKADRTGGNPRLASIYAGWYKAPNGQRYFGFGKVVEVGITHDDSVYVDVEPAQDLPGSK
ncbi:uncharacterized protein BDW70DRAFT_164740 [Aspergillus foveolatus]|uniref:uncharacterized protein n=1 Tax=Aspergillus foveolatus TaxID=210207 RepID=UPI003CCDC129